MSGLGKDKLVADTTVNSDFDSVVSYLRDGSGVALTSTLNGAKQSLDVNVTSPIAVDLNGIYNVTTNAIPDNVGLITHARSATPGAADQSFRSTGGSASADAIVAANVQGMDMNAFGMVYNGTTWDRMKGTAGAVNVNISTQSLAVQVVGNIADGTADSGAPVKVGTKAFGAALTATTSGMRSDMASDLYRRLYVNSASNVAVKSSAATVGLTAAALIAVSLAGRRSMVLQNTGAKEIYIGDSTVTVSTGIRVAAGGNIELDIGEYVSMSAIALTAGQTLRILERA